MRSYRAKDRAVSTSSGSKGRKRRLVQRPSRIPNLLRYAIRRDVCFADARTTMADMYVGRTLYPELGLLSTQRSLNPRLDQ